MRTISKFLLNDFSDDEVNRKDLSDNEIKEKISKMVNEWLELCFKHEEVQ